MQWLVPLSRMFLPFQWWGWVFCKFNSQNWILEPQSAWTSFFEIMKNQAFPVLGVKSSMEEVCGCRAMATLCWFFNFEILRNSHFWALWTCHHTLLKMLFYCENDYFWNWFEMIWKNEFLKLIEMIWKNMNFWNCLNWFEKGGPVHRNVNFIRKTKKSEVSDQLDLLHRPVCLKSYQIMWIQWPVPWSRVLLPFP